MKYGNRNARWALAVATLAVLISGSVALGSNMGFKFNMPVATAGVAPIGFNITSFPYLNPYTDREVLCQQLGLTPSTAVVQQFNAATGVLDLYLCGSQAIGSPSIPAIAKGGGFFITDGGTSGSAIVVGSHDPAFAVRLECPAGAPPLGDNWVSIPYHTTSDLMQDFCDEIGAAAVTISEFDATTGVLSFFNCGGNPLFDFSHTKGRSLKIVLDGASAECTGAGFANWVPNHF
jgi:hypothetical protein